MKADKAGSKFQPLYALRKEHNFRKIYIVINSDLEYDIDLILPQKRF